MRNRRRRVYFLGLFLILEFGVWVAPYAGHVYFKTIGSRPEPTNLALPVGRSRLRQPEKFDVLAQWSFDAPESLDLWEEKIFKGKTDYRVALGEDGSSYLEAKSAAASSGLYKKMKREVTPNLSLSWDWKALEFPKKGKPGKLADRSQDDFAARVYVIFPGLTFFNSTVIEYLWDESLPEGTVASSPFSDRVKLLVIHSGKAAGENGGWAHEDRNLYEDYTALFEQKPDRPFEAIAIMSDSDNTRSSSSAFFKNFELKLKKMGS